MPSVHHHLCQLISILVCNYSLPSCACFSALCILYSFALSTVYHLSPLHLIHSSCSLYCKTKIIIIIIKCIICTEGTSIICTEGTSKRRKENSYNQRVMEVESGVFTPLVFSTSGGMERECTVFYKRQADSLSRKRDKPYSVTMGWLRCCLNFALLHSAILCIRGSRSS